MNIGHHFRVNKNKYHIYELQIEKEEEELENQGYIQKRGLLKLRNDIIM